jgi:glutathione peroxidase-family protein
MSESLYDSPLRRLDGTAATLADYRGRVMLIVNVAWKCGLTPQYAGLQLIAAQPSASPGATGELADALAKHGLLPKQPVDVLWNFEKFLVGRDGRVVARFAPDIPPGDAGLVSAIEAALA